MSLWFFLFISYALVGAGLAGVWATVSASIPLPSWKRAVGITLYCTLWPAMLALDLIDALKIERKFRSARKRGEL